MGSTSSCAKCFLNVLTTLNALLGISMIAQATISLSEVPLEFNAVRYGLGGFIFVSSILGCCGICQENVCMTATYGFLLLAQLVIGLLRIFRFRFIQEDIEKDATLQVQHEWDWELVQPGGMDVLQKMYQCCGRNGPDDYVELGRSTLPASCHVEGDSLKPIFLEGCVYKSIESSRELYQFSNYTNWATVGITALMVIAAFYLVGRFHKRRTRSHY